MGRKVEGGGGEEVEEGRRRWGWMQWEEWKEGEVWMQSKERRRRERGRCNRKEGRRRENERE